MNDFIAISSILLVLMLTNGLYALFPYISRKTLSFGVSIPESAYDDPQISGMRRSFRNIITLCSLPFLASAILIMTYFSSNKTLSYIPSFIIILNLLADSLIYILFNRKMRKIKEEKAWDKITPQLISADTSFRRKNTLSSPLWFGLNFVVTAVTIGLSFIMYDQIPEKLGVKYNSAGQIIHWIDKSYKALMFIPALQIFITLVFIFAYIMLGKSRPMIDPANREKTMEQSIRYRYRWSAFLIVSGLALVTSMVFIQLSIMGMVSTVISIVITLAATFAMIIGIVIISAVSGQSGSRIKIENDKKNNPVVRDDDSFWKLGIFYYNPDDAALFVEKRIGVGWTFNWGRPSAWILFIALILAIIGFSAFSTSFFK